MRRGHVITTLVALTVIRLTAYAIGKPSASLADRAYVLAVGAVLLAGLLSLIGRHTTEPEPTLLDDAARPPDESLQRPARLAALEDLAAFGSEKAQGTHYHLRPYLRELLGDRLRARGIALDTDPRAPILLGPVAWELVRPDRPEPADGRRPGLDTASVSALTDLLERLP